MNDSSTSRCMRCHMIFATHFVGDRDMCKRCVAADQPNGLVTYHFRTKWLCEHGNANEFCPTCGSSFFCIHGVANSCDLCDASWEGEPFECTLEEHIVCTHGVFCYVCNPIRATMQYLVWHSRMRDKERGMYDQDLHITHAYVIDLLIEAHETCNKCSQCDTTMILTRRDPCRPVLGLIDASRAYTSDNCVLKCASCNLSSRRIEPIHFAQLTINQPIEPIHFAQLTIDQPIDIHVVETCSVCTKMYDSSFMMICKRRICRRCASKRIVATHSFRCSRCRRKHTTGYRFSNQREDFCMGCATPDEIKRRFHCILHGRYTCETCTWISCYHRRTFAYCRSCYGYGLCKHRRIPTTCKHCNPITATAKQMYHGACASDKRRGQDGGDSMTVAGIIDMIKTSIASETGLRCCYCNIIMSLTDHGNDMVSLERIRNDIGHINGNCILACLRCNSSRVGQRPSVRPKLAIQDLSAANVDHVDHAPAQ